LYNHFKIITTISPIQFQKNLRLEEAKQLLTYKDIEVSEAAYQVGYESPSQFSREFSRMFGISPKAFILQAQKLHL
jgi:AraC-like DNA-binding protein